MKKVFVVFCIALMLFAGISLTSVRSAHAYGPYTSVWVGSPVYGTWPDTQGCNPALPDTCSLPYIHHTFWGDLAFDIQHVNPGTPVQVFAAPQDSVTPVYTRVDTIGPVCDVSKYGYGTALAYGGYRVEVGVYTDNGVKLGKVVYAHIQPTVSVGQYVNRWGGTVGTVGSYVYSQYNTCWGGPHIHTELYSTYTWACYNRTWQPGQGMNIHDFIGFVSGQHNVWGQHQPCP